MSNPIYSPGSGFGQGSYPNQMGTALPGSLFSASDINLADSVTMSCPTAFEGSILAGSLVYLGYTKGQSGGRVGLNTMVASSTVITPASFGVVIRTQQTPTNSRGLGCVADGSMVTVLRSDRVGGRVWVLCTDTNVPAVGARTAYIFDGSVQTGALALTSANVGTAVDHIIVHAIESMAGVGMTLALLEFTTKA
jgi:hypothetical protein